MTDQPCKRSVTLPIYQDKYEAFKKINKDVVEHEKVAPVGGVNLSLTLLEMIQQMLFILGKLASIEDTRVILAYQFPSLYSTIVVTPE